MNATKKFSHTISLNNITKQLYRFITDMRKNKIQKASGNRINPM